MDPAGSDSEVGEDLFFDAESGTEGSSKKRDHSGVRVTKKGIPDGCYGNRQNPDNNIAYFNKLDRAIAMDFIGSRKNEARQDAFDGLFDGDEAEYSTTYQGYLPEERLRSAPMLKQLAKELMTYDQDEHDFKNKFHHFFSTYRHLRTKRRYFQGNVNYLNLFNREVDEFVNFKQKLIVNGQIAHSLRSSFVGTDRSVSYDSRRKACAKVQKVEWLEDEKDRFFQLLTRYSIHRLDEIKENLPNKSRQDILDYYHVLRSALRKCKREPKMVLQLVPMSDMPIAYEMTEEYIGFEESQANLMISPANKRDQTRFQNEKKRKKIGHVYSEEPDLIDWDVMAQLAPAFSHTEVPHDQGQEALVRAKMTNEGLAVALDSQILIKDIIVDLAYRILLGITEKRVSELSISQLDELNKVSVRITRDEVLKEFHKLTNRRSTLVGFWGDYARRRELIKTKKRRKLGPIREERFLNEQDEEILKLFHPSGIKVEDQESRQPDEAVDFDTAVANNVSIDKLGYVREEEERSSENADGLDPMLWKIADGEGDGAVAVDSNTRDHEEEEEDEEEEEVSRAHVLRKDDYDDDDKDFIADDRKTIKELEISEKLLLMETSILERMDHEASVKYERVLLGYMLSHPAQVDTNNAAMSEYYVCNKYYPKDLPFYYEDDLPFVKSQVEKRERDIETREKGQIRQAWKMRKTMKNECEKSVRRLKKSLKSEKDYRQRNQLEKALKKEQESIEELNTMHDLYHWTGSKMFKDEKTGTLRIPLKYDGKTFTFAYYNENDPFEMPVFNDVTDEMLLLHDYQYNEYERK
ncbi:DEKNAAC103476 [Brettanomyces naardenensis]|uniref:DEKNAAC103476 n=1 Tax=Brettanomyces naardenensis TaxID=13370 RepID=A0A448YNH7_BRENA|nr:DEKNAAC103476 [Brettanomyces naardenensis]